MGAQPREVKRWSLREAETDFPMHRDTIAKRLARMGEQPGEDGLYGTRQICAAVFGDYASERTRLAKEQADKVALENAERRRELVKVEDALEITRRFCAAIRAKFLATSLPDEEKNAVLREITRLAEADLTDPLPDEEDVG